MRYVLCALLVVVALPAAAGARVDALSPAQTVKSEDGLLIVRLPAGALAKPVKVRVRTLPRTALAAEDREALAPGRVYELMPEGLRFRKPVTVTRRVRGIDLRKGIPVLAPLLRDSQGRWELLGRPTVRQDRNTAVVTGTVRHFSDVAVFDAGGRVVLSPPSVRASLGDTFDATARIEGPGDATAEFWHWSASGSVVVTEQARGGTFSRGRPNTAKLTCKTIGLGEYTFAAELQGWWLAAVQLLLAVGAVANQNISVSVTGHALCEAPLPLSFTLTHNTPFVCAAITGPSGARLTLEMTMPNGQKLTGTLQLKRKEQRTVHGTFSFGTRQLGKHTLKITATVDGRSTTETKSIDVTSTPSSRTCGP